MSHFLCFSSCLRISVKGERESYVSLELHILFTLSHSVPQSEPHAKGFRNKQRLVWSQESVAGMESATTALASGDCDCTVYPPLSCSVLSTPHLQESLRTFIFLLYLKYSHKLLLGERENRCGGEASVMIPRDCLHLLGSGVQCSRSELELTVLLTRMRMSPRHWRARSKRSKPQHGRH